MRLSLLLLLVPALLGAQRESVPSYRGVRAGTQRAQLEQQLGVPFRCPYLIAGAYVCETPVVRLAPDLREFSVYIVQDSATREVTTIGFRRTVNPQDLRAIYEALNERWGSQFRPTNEREMAWPFPSSGYEAGARTTRGGDSLVIHLSNVVREKQFSDARQERLRRERIAKVIP